MDRILSTSEVHSLAERLLGSADYLGFVTQEMFDTEDIAIPSLQELDNIVFQCEGCGWWMEHSEMTDNPDKDWHCTHCADET